MARLAQQQFAAQPAVIASEPYLPESVSVAAYAAHIKLPLCLPFMATVAATADRVVRLNFAECGADYAMFAQAQIAAQHPAVHLEIIGAVTATSRFAQPLVPVATLR